jgi:uncharacterized damage-inducible protein DinB
MTHATTDAAPPMTPPAQSPAKKQFADVYARERATTLKVLRAFPADQHGFQPHERSNTALKLAWTFVAENTIAGTALRGEWKMPPEIPPAPATFAEVIAAYETSAERLLDDLTKAPDSKLSETVPFFSGPMQFAPIPIMELLWFMLLDSVHHRGQLSVYLRMAGGKVPSIYGPSADEPWR